MKKQTNLTLPEWAFLEASDHTGNALEGRDVLLHVRTHTMLEFFSENDLKVNLNPNVFNRRFTFKNSYGIIEHYKVAMHYSILEYSNLDGIVNEAIEYFKDWMTWMDKSIEQEDNSKIN